MRNHFFLVWLFLHCAGLSISSAQSVYLRSYGTAQGLPSPTIYDITADQKGYLWLVTESGPVRFDGENFWVPTHQHTHNKPGSLLVEDRFGRIWYESFDGYLLYIEQDTVRALAQTMPLGYIPFVVDSAHITYVTPYGLEQVPITQLQRRIRKPIPDFAPDFLFKMADTLVAVQNGRWIVSMVQNQTFRYKLKDPLYPQAPIFTPRDLGEIFVTTKFPKADRAIFAITSKSSRKVANISIPHPILVFKFFKNSFWIGTSQGLFIIDSTGKMKRHIPGLYVTSLFHHPNGSVWIGTRNRGLFRLDDLETRVLTLPDNQSPLTMESLGDHILIGTEQGRVWELNANLKGRSKLAFLAQHEISWIKKLADDRIAIGADQFYVVNKSYKSLLEVNLAAKDATLLTNGLVGVAATGLIGYFAIDERKRKWDVESMADFPNKWMSQVRGKWIAQDSLRGDLYFAGNTGLFTLAGNQLREVQWAVGQKIFVQNLFSFQGDIWVVTSNLQVWRREARLWRRMSKLPTPFHRIKVTQGRLFGCSDRQMYEWKGSAWELVRQVAAHDRLIDFTLLNNTMYCLVKNQVIQFPLRESNTDITSKLLVSPPKMKHLTDGELVEIPYSLIDFDQQRGRVFYQVNQSPWIELDPRASAVRLSALAPGDYQIRFRVDEVIRKTLAFDVPSPLFHRPVIWISLLVITAILYYAYYRMRLRRVARANQLVVDKLHLENRLKESRLKLIKAQMNPHFFFNALNTIQSYIATHENKLAEDYLQQFSRLTRMVLEMTDKSIISLDEELAMQQTYLELQRVRLKDFQYHIEVDPSLVREVTYLPTMLLQPYVENALMHGLSHSMRAKTLWLRFQVRDHFLWIEIEDDGIGRAKAAQINQASRRKHKSFATLASLERIALSHQDQLRIHIIDLPGPGTRVQIQIPYPYSSHESSLD